MTEFLETRHLLGPAIGLATFLVIGLFHPMVIKSEYYLGAPVSRWIFLVAGLLTLAASAWISDIFWSIILGVTAFSCFWSILEVHQQAERVAKGWFPANPKRRKGSDSSAS